MTLLPENSPDPSREQKWLREFERLYDMTSENLEEAIEGDIQPVIYPSLMNLQKAIFFC